MKEHPILMSGSMVRAILEDRKTHTRRVVRWPSHIADKGAQPTSIPYQGQGYQDTRPPSVSDVWAYCHCPYRQGGRLWLRETWRYDDFDSANVIYRADIPQDALDQARGIIKWRPSIYMPRWASRIMLEVTEIRVERVQEITEEDALAEGCRSTARMIYEGMGGPVDYEGKFAVDAFAELWDGLNENRGYGWEANPWTWVIGFKVVMKEPLKNA